MNSKITVGTAQFGLSYGVSNQTGQTTFEEACRILSFGMERGIDSIDTAVAYGTSESVLGRIGVDAWKVITKIASPPEGNQNIEVWFQDAIKNSLKRLNLKKIHGLLLHRPELLNSSAGEDLYNLAQSYKRSGIIDKFGISIYSPEELERIPEGMNLDIVQCPFNPFDRRIVLSGWLDKLKSSNCEVHTRSIFLQGLFLMNRSVRPKKFERWKKLWDDWEDWLSDSKLTALEACIGFVKAHQNIDRFVIGIESLNQLKGIVATMESNLKVETPSHFIIEDELLIDPSNWSKL